MAASHGAFYKSENLMYEQEPVNLILGKPYTLIQFTEDRTRVARKKASSGLKLRWAWLLGVSWQGINV
jgi:hypothetical protein